MRENIATIPLIDAFKADGECPFCHLEREAEQHAISFILGSAYMEDDIREKTDTTGFCRHHFKMMYDYGTHKRNEGFLARKVKFFKTHEKNRCNRSKASGDAAGFMDFSKSKQLLCM